ncbi:MAG: hypothetical protein AAF366_03410 [Pseudomonadota bacterium]
MPKMMTNIPARKVVGGSAGGALALLAIYVAETTLGLDIPEGIEGAISVLAMFATGYVTPAARRDRLDDDQGAAP